MSAPCGTRTRYPAAATAWSCPGGFSYGDYLRAGAMARFAPVMQGIVEFAEAGGLVLGICNGFQILCESGLLPGTLTRNASLRFVCRRVFLRVEDNRSPFTRLARPGELLEMPVKHGEGRYYADAATLKQLDDNGQVLLRYTTRRARSATRPIPTVRWTASPASATANATCSA